MKKNFILFLVVFFLGACGADDEEADAEAETTEQEEVEEEVEGELEDSVETDATEEESTSDEEVTNEEEVTWDDIKDKDKIVGQSDKDYSEISSQSPLEVRNDVTGDWRYSTISENIDIEEHALSYQNLHMNEDEVHFIINFNYNTTTTLNNLGGLLYVDIHEYEDGEEHDASTLGSGMLLKSYIIYPDGEIEEVDI